MMHDESNVKEHFIGKDVLPEKTLFSFSALIQALKSIKSINIYRSWSTLVAVKALVKSNKIRITHSEWCDDFQKKYVDIYPLDFQKISTYENCVDMFMYAENGDIFIKVTIFERDRDGYRTKENSIYILQAVEWDDFYKPILENIVVKLTKQLLDKEEKERQQKLFENANQRILNSLLEV